MDCRCLLFVSLLLAVATCQTPGAVSSTEFIIVIGQSNADGHGMPIQEIDRTSDPNIVDTNVLTGDPVIGTEPFSGYNYTYFDTPSSAYRPWRIGLNPHPGVSPCGELAREYRRVFQPTARTQVLKCAFGGTGFISDGGCPTPVNGSTFRTWYPNGTCFLHCRNRIQQALANPRVGNASIAFIYWHQGETEAGADLEISDHRSTLELMLDSMRGLLDPIHAWQGVSNSTPFIGGPPHYVWSSAYKFGPDQNYTAMRINAAIADLVRTRPNVGFASSVSLAPSTFHLDAVAQKQLARQAVQEVLRIQALKSGTLAPTLAPTRAPTGTSGSDPYAGSVPFGTSSYYPLAGDLNDYGPFGYDPFTVAEGYNQTVQFAYGPYPFNDTLTWKSSRLSTGHCALVIHDQLGFNYGIGNRYLLSGITHNRPSAYSRETNYYDPVVTEEGTMSVWYYYEGSEDGRDVPYGSPLAGPGIIRQTRGVISDARYFPGTRATGDGCLNGISGNVLTQVKYRSWNQFAIRYKGLMIDLFIDGVLASANCSRCTQYMDLREITPSMGPYVKVLYDPLLIDCATEYRRGLRVYKRRLSDSEMLDLFNAEKRTGVGIQATWTPRVAEANETRWTFEGNSYDEPAYGNHTLTIHTTLMTESGPQYRTIVPANKRTVFGVASNVTYGGNVFVQDAFADPVMFSEPTAAFTLCYAMYPNHTSGTCSFGAEIDACPDGSTLLSACEQITIHIGGSGLALSFQWSNAIGEGSSTTMNYGQWVHFCFVVDNTPTNATAKVYMNGNLIKQRTRPGRRTLRPSIVGLGAGCTALYDQVVYVDRAFSQEEVTSESTTVMMSTPTSTPTAIPTSTNAPTAAPTTRSPTAAPSTRSPSSSKRHTDREEGTGGGGGVVS